MKKIFVSIIIIFLYSSLVLSQEKIALKSIGYPFIDNYINTEYGGASQNWAAIQDTLGILYFGNQSGLLTFDGNDWNIYPLESREGVKSLTRANNGKIYFGTNGDFGHLASSPTGELQIISLKKLLPKDAPEIGTISNTLAIDGYVFFQSQQAIYILDILKNSVSIQKGQNLRYPTGVGSFFYVLSQDGLLKSSGKQFELISKSKISHIFQINNELSVHFLDGTLNMYDGSRFKDTENTFQYSAKNLRLSKQIGSYLLIGTNDNGVKIYTQDGNLVITLNEATGLASNSINAIYLDHFLNLWVMHDMGLSKVEWNSAYSIIDERSGLNGSAIITELYDSSLFTGTYNGLFQSNWQQGKEVNFKKISNDHHSFWYLLKDKNSVIAGNNNSVIEFQKAKSTMIHHSADVSYAMAFTKNRDYILAGTKYNFFVLKKNKNGWALHKEIKNFHQLCDFLLPIDDQSFWMSNSGSGLFKLTLSPAMDSLYYESYDENDGLPSIYNNRIFQHQNQIKFTTTDGVYDYNVSLDRFQKDTILSDLMENEFVYRFEESPSGEIWFVHGGKNGILYPTENGYRKVYLPNKKLEKFNNENINPIDSRNVLISNNYGLLHIDPTRSLINDSPYRSLITKVTNILNDSVIATVYADKGQKFVFDSEVHSLKFEFSSTSFEDFRKNEFQWRLIGYDKEWSSFKKENRKDFTNLAHGTYTFQVRAKNVYDIFGSTAQFHFTILPPWYMTWWAISLFVVFVIFILLFVIWINTRRLKKENERLELVVETRTSEIKSQKETIEKSLIERESLLKEIHHRVKNNLQIIASLLYLQSGKFEDQDFKRVLEEGQGRVRSMALIHQKLYENEDLKSIPFGEYLQELVSEIRASFGMGDIQLNIEAENIFFDVDTAVPLGLIVNEMATNAFKYAYEKEGKGTLSIFITEENGEYLLNVKDDGKGIPDEIDIRKTKSLGLRLVRMLSQQLEGDFEFGNDNGTNFKLKFAA